jgi:hypothetical protein
MTNPNPSPELLPMSEAPKDGSYILGYYRSIDNERTEHWDGRAFVIRHEGKTASDYDLGWALFPGYGGVPDICFAGWAPLPAALSRARPASSLSTDVQSAATGCHEHDVSLKVAMPAPGEVEAGTGWVAWNPDSGEEYTPNHPVESGECVEAERIRRSTPQEDVLWNAFQGEFQRAHDLETRLAATPTLATVAAGDDEGVARIIDPKAWQDRDEYMALRGRAASWDSTADSLAKAAAIRLLSQGEGK